MIISKKKVESVVVPFVAASDSEGDLETSPVQK